MSCWATCCPARIPASDAVVHMAWPGDEAVDEARWDDDPDWRMREYLLRRLGLTGSCESTDRLLLRHCDEQIAEYERSLGEEPDLGTQERREVT